MDPHAAALRTGAPVNRQQRRAAGGGGKAGGAGGMVEEAAGLHRQGRLAEAEAGYRAALALDPAQPDALHLLGVAAHQGGRAAEGVALMSRAVRLRPGEASYRSNLGNALRDAGRPDEAIQTLREAVRLDPAFADGRYNLGVALQAAGMVEEAEREYRIAVSQRPEHPESHDNLGAALKARGDLEGALRCHRAALRLRPGFAGAMTNMGAAQKEAGDLAQAEEWCRKAAAADPRHKEAHFNLGTVLEEMGRKGEAEAAYRAAAAIDPGFAAARYNLSMVLLSLGRMEEGWREYEWRWRVGKDGPQARSYRQPLWTGEAGHGRTLLIHSEQGFGDTIQFCRYAPLAVARGFRVILKVDRPLRRLMGTLAGVAEVAALEDEEPASDLHCPMLSLPAALGTTLETIPAATPYLAAEPEAAAAWEGRLTELGRARLRVGLAWAGNPLLKEDAKRSVSVARLGPLLDVPGASFVSLQKVAAGGDPRIADMMADVGDFADAAALIAGLDLVVSVDTAVAHLAGAMGKEVWLLDRFNPCWRWLHGRSDSPWYPRMRIYRQAGQDGWDDAIGRAARDLGTRTLA